MEDLSPGDGEGAWQEITEMRNKGWMVLGASGNWAVDGVYPGLLDETEAVEKVRFTEEGAVFPLLHEDWAQLTAPSNLSVYNPDEDKWLELTGTSFATNVASAVYARVWEAAPDLTDIELNDIVLRTAEPFTHECSRRETTFEKRFIMPYRAIRVASVYQDIKRAVSAHRWGRTDSAALRGRVREALNDFQDGPTFADLGAYEEIFPGGATGEMQPLETVLDILIEKSMELVPGHRLKEALATGPSAPWTCCWMEPVGIGTSLSRAHADADGDQPRIAVGRRKSMYGIDSVGLLDGRKLCGIPEAADGAHLPRMGTPPDVLLRYAAAPCS